MGLVNHDRAWDYTNIKAWIDLSGCNINPWVVAQIRSLSSAYLAHRADYSTPEKKDADPPYMSDEFIAWRRAQVESKFKLMLERSL